MSRARTQDPEAGPTPLYNTPTSSLSPVRPRIRTETASGGYTDWSGLVGLWVTGGIILSARSIYDVDTATLVHRLKELVAPPFSRLVQPTDSWGPDSRPMAVQARSQSKFLAVILDASDSRYNLHVGARPQSDVHPF